MNKFISENDSMVETWRLIMEFTTEWLEFLSNERDILPDEMLPIDVEKLRSILEQIIE